MMQAVWRCFQLAADGAVSVGFPFGCFERNHIGDSAP